MLDTNSGAFPVGCENIAKRTPGPIALPIQTAPDPCGGDDIIIYDTFSSQKYQE